MKDRKKLAKSVNVKDIQCKDCIRYRDPLGLYDGGLCTRLVMDCNKARKICTKTAWYVDMCTMDAMLEAEL